MYMDAPVNHEWRRVPEQNGRSRRRDKGEREGENEGMGQLSWGRYREGEQ